MPTAILLIVGLLILFIVVITVIWFLMKKGRNNKPKRDDKKVPVTVVVVEEPQEGGDKPKQPEEVPRSEPGASLPDFTRLGNEQDIDLTLSAIQTNFTLRSREQKDGKNALDLKNAAWVVSEDGMTFTIDSKGRLRSSEKYIVVRLSDLSKGYLIPEGEFDKETDSTLHLVWFRDNARDNLSIVMTYSNPSHSVYMRHDVAKNVVALERGTETFGSAWSVRELD